MRGCLLSPTLPGSFPPVPRALQNSVEPTALIHLSSRRAWWWRGQLPFKTHSTESANGIVCSKILCSEAVQDLPLGEVSSRTQCSSSSHYRIGNLDELKQLEDERPGFAPHVTYLTLPIACIRH